MHERILFSLLLWSKLWISWRDKICMCVIYIFPYLKERSFLTILVCNPYIFFSYLFIIAKDPNKTILGGLLRIRHKTKCLARGRHSVVLHWSTQLLGTHTH